KRLRRGGMRRGGLVEREGLGVALGRGGRGGGTWSKQQQADHNHLSHRTIIAGAAAREKRSATGRLTHGGYASTAVCAEWPARYCSSVTFSNQVTGEPLSDS